MWELDHKEGWELKNWGFWIMLGRTLESLLDCKKIKPVNPKGNQPWIFIGRTDAEALILWPPDVKNWLSGKDPSGGKDWRQEEKGSTEDEMGGWHHQLDGHEFEQAPGRGEGQGSLVCFSPWGCKESDMTQWLNDNDWESTVWGAEGGAELMPIYCCYDSKLLLWNCLERCHGKLNMGWFCVHLAPAFFCNLLKTIHWN